METDYERVSAGELVWRDQGGRLFRVTTANGCVLEAVTELVSMVTSAARTHHYSCTCGWTLIDYGHVSRTSIKCLQCGGVAVRTARG